MPMKPSMKNKSEVIKRIDIDENGDLKIEEIINKIDPEELKQLEKQEEAERAIREMEADKGKLNYYKISEDELAEVASIDSSNIDYVDIFEGRLNSLDQELQRVYTKINRVYEIIERNDKKLQELSKKSVSEVQEY